MNYIEPLEISSKIMTLIDEAEEELIIVSPYVDIKDWEKMKKRLKLAVNRNIKISFYCRANTKQNLDPLRKIGIEPILIEDLHAKIYLNENMAIVTSQNMVLYSDTNSLDIGHYTDDVNQIKPLRKFVDRLLNSKKIHFKYSEKFDKNAEDYINKIKLEKKDVEILLKALSENFYHATYTPTSTYIFSDNLFDFCETMIGSDYVIKLWKKKCDYEGISNKLKKIKTRKLKHNFETFLKPTHKDFYHFGFRPIDEINIDDLVEDYLEITKSISETI